MTENCFAQNQKGIAAIFYKRAAAKEEKCIRNKEVYIGAVS